MKKSALTVGAVTILSEGVGFAIFDYPGRKNCPRLQCDGYDAADAEVFVDRMPNDPAAVFFTVGKCKCKGNGLTQEVVTFDAWTPAQPPEDQEVFFIKDREGMIKHTAGHSLPTHEH